MADSNLNTSIASLKTELLNSIPTATVDELVSIARSAKGMNLGEDAALEQAIDSRVNTLSATATNDEIAKLATVVKQFLNPAAITVTNFTSVTGDLIPDTNEAYDLGSTSNRFKDLYISGNTMFLGDTKIQDDGTELKFLDSSDNPRKMKAKEIDLDDGSGKIRLKRNAQGNLDFRTIDNSGNDTGAVSTESSGATVAAYSLMSELPLTGVAAGAQAFVSENNKLFLWTGTGWYNIALVNQTPSAISGANATYNLAIDGTPTVVTLNATDPEGIPLTWSYQVTTGALGSTATVAQADNVFTITPSATEADAGTFTLTFSASDGVNQSVASSDFSLAFAPPEEEIVWIGDDDYNGANNFVTYTWTVPAGVTEISALVVGAGGGGAHSGPEKSGGGGGGGLAWLNNIPVTPGEDLTIRVGSSGRGKIGDSNAASAGATGGMSQIRNSTLGEILTANAGTGGTLGGTLAYGGSINHNATLISGKTQYVDYGGANGGAGGGGYDTTYAAGGGGAGGYRGGTGGTGGTSSDGLNFTAGATGGGAGGRGMNINSGNTWGGYGGGVSIYGEGNSGVTASAHGSSDTHPSGVHTQNIGRGGRASHMNGFVAGYTQSSGWGGPGAVRIIWGSNRKFPSTNVSKAVSDSGNGQTLIVS